MSTKPEQLRPEHRKLKKTNAVKVSLIQQQNPYKKICW